MPYQLLPSEPEPPKRKPKVQPPPIPNDLRPVLQLLLVKEDKPNGR